MIVFNLIPQSREMLLYCLLSRLELLKLGGFSVVKILKRIKGLLNLHVILKEMVLQATEGFHHA